MKYNAFKYLDDLKEAGFPAKQAEVIAKGITEFAESELATKKDIELVKRDIKELESRMKLHMIITSGSFAFFILTAMVSLAKLGLLTPAS